MLYNGTILTDEHKDSIIVTTNYRLGALGFLYSAAGFDGNFGFLDQVAAMKWVQANIASFGGNPQQVTLFGQSAGASSIACHLTAKTSAGLFHAAILESQPFSLFMKTKKDWQPIADRFFTALGCGTNDAACVRNQSVPAILAAQEKSRKHLSLSHPLFAFYPFTILIDANGLVPMQPMAAALKGLWPKMPIILGNVANETVVFIYQAYPKGPPSKIDADAFLADVFGPVNAVKIALRYKWRQFPDIRLSMAHLASYYIMTCSNRAVARALSQSGNQQVYYYLFDHVMSFSKGAWGPNYTYCDHYSCHGEELPFVWQTAGLGGLQYTKAELAMSKSIGAAWTNLAKSMSSPNKPEVLSPSWPAWGTAKNYQS